MGIFRVFRGKWGGLSLHFRLRGGEGGIRTLGTGVSPYNGLANGSFSPPSLVFKHLPSDSLLQVGLRASHSAVIVLRFVLRFVLQEPPNAASANPQRTSRHKPTPPSRQPMFYRLHCGKAIIVS